MQAKFVDILSNEGQSLKHDMKDYLINTIVPIVASHNLTALEPFNGTMMLVSVINSA